MMNKLNFRLPKERAAARQSGTAPSMVLAGMELNANFRTHQI
jgi:hypothetical protein